MSDDMAAPEMEGTDAPGAPGPENPALAKPRPPLRPGLSAKPASPRAVPKGKPSKLKGILMLGIILAVVGLSGVIVWRLILRISPEKKELVIADEVARAMLKAEGERKQIEDIENMVVLRGQALGGKEMVDLQTHLQELQKCSAIFDNLRAQLQEKKEDALRKKQADKAKTITESGDWILIEENQIVVKLWILDAMELLEVVKYAPDYGGLYVPMRRAEDVLRKSKDELKDMQTLSDEIAGRNDAAELARMRARLKDLETNILGCQKKFEALDKFVVDGLARPELTPKEIKELGWLRDNAANAGMSMGQIRILRAKFRESP